MVHFSEKRFAVRSVLCACGVSLIALMSASPAGAQENDARIKRLENEIQTLSRAVFRGEKPPQESLALGPDVSSVNAANTELRLQQLEMDLRNLTGKIEEDSYETQQFRSKVEQSLGAFETRLNALETRINSGGGVSGSASSNGFGAAGSSSGGSVSSGLETLGPGGSGSSTLHAVPLDDGNSSGGTLGTVQPPPETPSFQTAPPLSANDPVGLYEQAFSYLKDKDYDSAEKGFQQFLARYPDNDLAANAWYWLGESFYVRNDFEQAARTFAESYQKYPKGPKGPDNLLKLGMSLSALGKKQDACLTYVQLKKQYPNGAMPILSRADQESERLGCGAL